MAQLVEKQMGDSTPVWEMQTASAGQIDACCGLGRGVNLLDNWYFIGGGSQQGGGQFPINQRGKTEYAGSGYTIDQWKLISGDGLSKTTVLSDGITVQCLSENDIWFQEMLENDCREMGIMTLSMLVAEITGDVYLCLSDGGPNTHITTSGLHTVTNTMFGSEPLVRVVVNPNSSLKIKAIKLEFGPVQTLAHQDASGNWILNDPPPNFQQELAKCQAYYLPIGGNTFGYCGAASFDPNNRVVFMDIPTPVTMAGKPSIITSPSATAVVTQGGVVFPLPNPTVDEVHANGVRIFFGNLTAPTTWSRGPVGIDNLRFAFSVDI